MMGSRPTPVLGQRLASTELSYVQWDLEKQLPQATWTKPRGKEEGPRHWFLSSFHYWGLCFFSRPHFLGSKEMEPLGYRLTPILPELPRSQPQRPRLFLAQPLKPLGMWLLLHSSLVPWTNSEMKGSQCFHGKQVKAELTWSFLCDFCELRACLWAPLGLLKAGKVRMKLAPSFPPCFSVSLPASDIRLSTKLSPLSFNKEEETLKECLSFVCIPIPFHQSGLYNPSLRILTQKPWLFPSP